MPFAPRSHSRTLPLPLLAVLVAAAVAGLGEGLVIDRPSGIAGIVEHTLATFGPQKVDGKTSVTGKLVGGLASSEPPTGCKLSDYGSAAAGKVLLAQRGECEFIDKAAVAQNLSAAALVVWDFEWEPLRRMSTTDDDLAATIDIPCLFISRDDGAKLQTAMWEGINPVVTINATGFVDDPFDTDWQMSILWFLFIAFVIMWVLVFICFSMALCRRWCQRTARQRAVRTLQRRKYKAVSRPADGAAKDEETGEAVDPDSRYEQTQCVICQEDFETGDKLVVLPCGHEYHSACIKPWLLKRSNKCPICGQSCMPSPNSAAPAGAETPLLDGSDSLGQLEDGGASMVDGEGYGSSAEASRDDGGEDDDDDDVMIDQHVVNQRDERGDFWSTHILGLPPGALVLTAACCTGLGIAVAIVIFLMSPE